MKLTHLTVSRMIPAVAEKGVRRLDQPEESRRTVVRSRARDPDPVVDGLFYFAVKHEGRTWPHYGRFLQIERPRLVEYPWMSEATKGGESNVTVTMEQRGEQTEVTLRHSGVPDDEMGRQHEEGWNWILSALAEGFASRRSAS